MTSSPLDYTHSRRMSAVACRHRLWRAQTVGRRKAWHAITALELADTVERLRAWYAITAVGRQIRSNDVGLGMPSTPLDSTHGRTMSGVACHRFDNTHGRTTSGVTCHHRLWAAHTIEGSRAWHAIIALGRQTPSNDVKGGMPSSPFGSTNGRTMLGVACHRSTWTANTVKRRQA